MKHYTFGSSTAARTDACTGWVSQSEGIPRKESSYATDGTIIHTLLEDRLLADDFSFKAMLGKKCRETGETITDSHVDMAEEMWACTTEVLQRHGALEWEPECTGTAGEDVGGTLDLIANCGDKTLLVDFKTGMGVQVSPVNNKQILFATAVCSIDSAASDLLEGVDNFVGVILQPDSSGVVRIKEWEFTREQVDLFWKEHQDNIAAARTGKGELCPGDHCKFCPANAGLCPATNGNLLRATQMDLDDVEDLLWVLNTASEIEATIKAAQKLAFEQLELGVELEGWKLVEKLSNRRWVSEEEVIRKLRRPFHGKRNLMTNKLITPAQAEKMAKKEGVEINIDKLTERTVTGTTLAPESDKRAAILSTAGFAAAIASIK